VPELAALFGQCDAAAHPVEHFETERVFEPADLIADRALGQIELVGGSCNALVQGDDIKQAEAVIG